MRSTWRPGSATPGKAVEPLIAEAGVDGLDDVVEDGVLPFIADLLPLRDTIAGFLAQVCATGTVGRPFGGPRAGNASSDSVFSFADWSSASWTFCFPFATSDMERVAPETVSGSDVSGPVDEGGGCGR